VLTLPPSAPVCAAGHGTVLVVPRSECDART
jgi:hypothetical protein